MQAPRGGAPKEKENIMLRKRILVSVVALACAGFGVGALAEQAGDSGKTSDGKTSDGMAQGGGMMHGGMMHGGMMGHGMMGQGGMMGGCPMMGMDEGSSYVEGRLGFLKAELAVTDAQKDVWAAFGDALKHNFENMQATRKSMMESMQGKTPVERLDAHIATMEGRVKTLKEVKPVLAKLYDALSPEQRKKADEVMNMGCMK